MISIHPNQDRGHYFFVQEAEMLPKFKWSLGMMMLYDNDLLNIKWETVFVGPGGRTTTRVDERHGIDHLVYDYFYGAVGLTDWMSLAFDVPLFVYYHYGWTTSNVSSSTNRYFKPGDIWLSAKFRLLDGDKHPVGIAFIPSISIPTGKDEHFLGDQNVTGEGKVVVEIKPLEKLRASFNIALQTREQVSINDISFRNTLKFAAAAAYDVTDNVALIGELESHTVTNDFYGSRRTSPAEARVGARWHPGGGPWSIGGGGSVGLVSGVGMPRFAMFASVGYDRTRYRPKIITMEPAAALVLLTGQDMCYAVAPLTDDIGGRYRVVCTVHFDFDATVTRDVKTLNEIVRYVKSVPGGIDLEIRGWADPVGGTAYNKILSRERADSVAHDIRTALGENKDRVTIRTIGVGEDNWSPHEKARRADTLIR